MSTTLLTRRSNHLTNTTPLTPPHPADHVIQKCRLKKDGRKVKTAEKDFFESGKKFHKVYRRAGKTLREDMNSRNKHFLFRVTFNFLFFHRGCENKNQKS